MTTKSTAVVVRLPLSEEQKDALILSVYDGEYEKGVQSIGTPVAGGERDYESTVAHHEAKLAERDAEIARLEAKQPLYDRILTENGDLWQVVARLQSPEFYGTESQDIGSDDISSLFDFCKDNEVIEINGYRCVSTQFGFFDGTDVHLYSSEDEALIAAKALIGGAA